MSLRFIAVAGVVSLAVLSSNCANMSPGASDALASALGSALDRALNDEPPTRSAPPPSTLDAPEPEPTPETADTIPTPAQKEPGRQIRSKRFAVYLGPDQARIVRGDGEINSDDWTWVRVRYSISGMNTRQATLNVTYEAREGNRNKSFGDTYFIATRKFPVGTFPSAIKSFSHRSGEVTRWLKGKRHGYQEIGSNGPFRNLKVSFDAKGRNDLNSMKLSAVYSVRVGL